MRSSVVLPQPLGPEQGDDRTGTTGGPRRAGPLVPVALIEPASSMLPAATFSMLDTVAAGIRSKLPLPQDRSAIGSDESSTSDRDGARGSGEEGFRGGTLQTWVAKTCRSRGREQQGGGQLLNTGRKQGGTGEDAGAPRA